MLIELVKHKQLGDINNIFFVLHAVLSEKPQPIADIKKYCSTKSIELIYAIDGILALLEFTGIISCYQDAVRLNNNIPIDIVQTADKRILAQTIIEMVFIKIKESADLNEFLLLEKIKFDPALNQLSILNNAIPLQYSSLKNLLINLGGFQIRPEYPSILLIDKAFQKHFESVIIPWIIEEREKTAFSRRETKLTLEELFEIQELKNQYGAQAEEFVLLYEKNRLQDHSRQESIRRISNFDVGAGFDIVSFENSTSENFDRFIEVKSFSKYPEFYWSKKEVITAKIKQDSYYLYLVDREKIGLSGYQPLIIQNPYKQVFQNPDWQKDAQSWLIKRENEESL